MTCPLVAAESQPRTGTLQIQRASATSRSQRRKSISTMHMTQTVQQVQEPLRLGGGTPGRRLGARLIVRCSLAEQQRQQPP